MSDHSPHANDCPQPAVAGPVQRPVRPRALECADWLDGAAGAGGTNWNRKIALAAQELRSQHAEIERLFWECGYQRGRAMQADESHAKEIEAHNHLKAAARLALEDLGAATSFNAKRSRDRCGATLRALRVALGPNVGNKGPATAAQRSQG